MSFAIAPALALAGAVTSAVSMILIRRGVRGYGPYTATWITLVVGTTGVWVVVFVTGEWGEPSLWSIGLFALAGLIGTVAGRLLRFISIEAVGPSITAALSNLNPLVSTGLAILLLGEHVTLPILMGTLVIVGGTTLLSVSGGGFAVRPSRLVLPLLSAVCFGVVAILRKIGLGDMGPVPGFAVNVTAAFVAFTAFLIVSRQVSAMACRGRSLVYFLAAGVTENVAVFLIIQALVFGTVSVVAPLASVASIFVLALSFFFLRGIEILTARIVIGTLLIVVGVWLITAFAGR